MEESIRMRRNVKIILCWHCYFFNVLVLHVYVHCRGITDMKPFKVFPIWKSLWVLKKAYIKIVASAIYIYLIFSNTYTLLFCWKIKNCCNQCFPQQIRPDLFDRALNTTLDYLSCFAVVLKEIHRKVDICQTNYSIHSKFRIPPYHEVIHRSTVAS